MDEAEVVAFRKTVEEKLLELGPDPSRQAILEAVKDTITCEVEAKVAEKTDELWQRGKQMLHQMQQKQKERTSRLTEEVVRCQANCSALEEENTRLKQALAGLIGRLSVLGAVLSSKEALLGGPCALGVDAGAAVLMSPGAAEFLTPGPFGVAGDGTEVASEAAIDAAAGIALPATPLPAVPDFPFPGCLSPTPGTPGAPLSLAEALQRTPQRTPLSLATSLPGTPLLEVPPPFLRNPEVHVFSFTLRKADNADLGLNVAHHENDKVLCIESINPGGSVEAWNRQCSGREKAVHPGDKIISVNNVMYDPPKMLEECKNKQLLKLTIARGEGPLPQLATPAKATTLRADASVFVPMGVELTVATTPAPATAAAPSAEAAAGGGIAASGVAAVAAPDEPFGCGDGGAGAACEGGAEPGAPDDGHARTATEPDHR